MTRSKLTSNQSFWTSVLVRVVGIFIVGLAMIVLFREVLVPVFMADVENIQRKHGPPDESISNSSNPAR